MFYEKDNLLLKDIEVSVERILKAITKKENILIFGDCDADGITSTAILYDFLTQLGGIVNYYVLNRNTEGYGLSEIAVNNFLNMRRPNLVITVDCGTTDITSVKKLKERDIDTIITDHHECGNESTEAVGVINPKVHDKYLSRELAGVGVVLKLIIALCKKKKLEEECYLRYMDRVALGTIADRVSTTDYENVRILKCGITRMIRNPSVGVKMLVESSSLKDKYRSSSIDIEEAIKLISGESRPRQGKISLVPLINARWKSGKDAKICVELLTTDDVRRASEIISELKKDKEKNREIEEKIKKEAERIIKKDEEVEISTQVQNKDNIILVSVKDCEERVRVKVASKLQEKYKEFCKAAIVCIMKNGQVKGTGNSDEGFNLFRALVGCRENKLLKGYNGHRRWCGFTTNKENIVRVKGHINNIIKISEQSAKKLEELANNKKVKEIELTLEKAQTLKDLKAQGIFSCRSLRIVDYKQISNEGNYKLLVLKCKDTCCIETIASEEIGMINVIQKDNYVDIKFKISEFENTSWIEIQEINLSKINDRQIKEQNLETVKIKAQGITLDNARKLRNSKLFRKKQLFLCCDMKIIKDPETSRNGDHLKLVLAGDDNQNINAIWFDEGKDRVKEFRKGDLVDVEFEYNEYKSYVQMKIKRMTVVKEYLEDEKYKEIISDEIKEDSETSRDNNYFKLVLADDDKRNCKAIKINVDEMFVDRINTLKDLCAISLFSCSGLRILNWHKEDNHLKLELAGDDTPIINAIAVDMEDKISSLKRGACSNIEFNITESMGQVELKIQKLKILERTLETVEINSNEMTIDNVKKLSCINLLKNADPIFLCRNMKVTNYPRKIQNSLRLELSNNSNTNIHTNIDAIACELGDMAGYIKRNDRVDVAFEMDECNNDVQMRIKAMRLREYSSKGNEQIKNKEDMLSRKRTTVELVNVSNKRTKLG